MNRVRTAIATLAGIMLCSAAPDSLPTFVDILPSSGIAYRNHASHTSKKHLIETMGGGVALLDIDNDGRLDIYFVNGAALRDPMPPGALPDKSEPRFWNALYRNNGNGTFTDVTRRAGVRGDHYGMGAVAADYDNDGFTDLYVTNFGTNILYRNNGDGTFRDVTREAGVAAGQWSSSAAFLDYDRDGYLDLVVSRYLVWDLKKSRWCGEPPSYCHPDEFQPATHLLYRNNGDGSFTDVSESSGLGKHPGAGLGVAVADVNRDGWPDILIANDARPQQLFLNRQDGSFEEQALDLGMAYDEDGKVYSGMGIAAEDYNNDGWPDVFINNLALQRYAIYENRKGVFHPVSGSTNVGRLTQQHSGWGAGFVDFDNDGWKDLFVAQGHVMDNIALTQPSLRYSEPLLLLRNAMGKKFEDVTPHSGPPFRVPVPGRGAAFGDLDNNGFIDIVVNRLNGPPMILMNKGNGNHWLRFHLRGRKTNRDAVGAAVTIQTKTGRQHGWVGTGGSYQSSSDRKVHFGLGSDAQADRVEIRWPSGAVQELRDIQADQEVLVEEVR